MSETEKPSQEKEEHSKIEEIKENNENISLLIFLFFYSRVGFHHIQEVQSL